MFVPLTHSSLDHSSLSLSASLTQTLITQKEAQSEKYQRLLQEARSQLQSITEAHKSEVASLVKKLHAQCDSAVLKLKEATMEAVAMPTVVGATEEQLARLHELEDLIGQQRVSYEARLEGVKREYAQAKQVYETSLIRVRQEMGEMKQNHFIQTESESRYIIRYIYNYS